MEVQNTFDIVVSILKLQSMSFKLVNFLSLTHHLSDASLGSCMEYSTVISVSSPPYLVQDARSMSVMCPACGALGLGASNIAVSGQGPAMYD